jgi:ABC-type sugar transport system ATPase subunit
LSKERAEPLGTSTILHLNVGSIPLVMETREFVTYDQLRGAKLDLQFEMDKIHVFDKNGDTIL